MIKIYSKKINNILNKFDIKLNDSREILHKDLINVKYPIIAAIGKKNGGKTSSLYNMLDVLIYDKNPGVNIHIFSTSQETDPIINKIKDKYDDNDFINIYSYEDIIIDKINILDELIDKIKENTNNDNNDNDETSLFKSKNSKNDKISDRKIKKYIDLKYIVSQNIIIFDDVTHLLRKPLIEKSINRLFTTQRHIYTSVILIAHSYKGLGPVARSNINL